MSEKATFYLLCWLVIDIFKSILQDNNRLFPFFMKQLILAVSGFLLLVGCSSAPSSVSDTEDGPITIGAIGALSGDAADYGQLVQKVSNVRFDEINEAGGINGRLVEVIWEDGKCNPADASRAAQKLVNVDKVNVILGGACSGETLGAAPITEKKDVILLSSISSSPEVTNAGDFVFRTYPSDSSQGKVLAEYANNQGFKKIGVLVEQTDYSVALASVFKDHFDGDIIEEVFLPTESDLRTRITKLKNAELDTILLDTNSAKKTSLLLKQLEELGWDMPVIGNEMIMSDVEVTAQFVDFLQRTNAVGASFVTPEDMPEYTDFVTTFVNTYGEPPKFANYAATTLDAVDVLKKVLSEVDDVTDTKAIRDALYDFPEYKGFSGRIAFDENGDVKGVHTLFQFEGQNFIPLVQ